MKTTLFGYRNVRFHAGASANGYAKWFATREERDEAMEQLRDRAVDAGISTAGARAGIYEISKEVSASVAKAILDMQ